MEAVYRDYAPRGVQFYYVYKALAHPETNGYLVPVTLKERLLHVKEAQRRLGSKIPWICDTMDNSLKHSLGNRPNSDIVIDPSGTILSFRQWNNAGELRADLEKYVGKVENPTRVSDIKLNFIPPPKVAASGVVPRMTLNGQYSALKLDPVIKAGAEPFYVKLRAEADSSLLRNGSGKLYLNFRMDPLYGVHWNNLVKPLSYSIETSKDISISARRGEAAKVEQPADIDPREFLLDVNGWDDEELHVTVNYFACSDEEGWCKPLTQTYTIVLDADRDAGRAQRRGSSGRGPRIGQRPGGGFGRPGSQQTRSSSRFTLVVGRVVSMNLKNNELVVMSRDRSSRTHKLSDDCKLTLNGRPASVSSLSKGDQVMLRVKKVAAGESSVVGSITARGQK